MKVTSITVKGYRNLANQTVSPDGGLNIFVGDNAQGKTNLLESVYLCCIGKSPRTEKDRDLVRWNTNIAHVKTSYSCRFGNGEIAIGIADGKKHISVNSVAITKLGDLLGYLNCIYFSPNEIKIISQSPAERRKFLDVDLCQTDKAYFYSLARFNKALAQRNNLLKQPSSPEKIAQQIFAWDEILAEEGAKIICKRRQFCERLKVFAKQCHLHLSDDKETLELTYQTQIIGDKISVVAENYRKALADNLDKDLQLHYTTVGCQRDDVMLKLDGIDVRSFGSQGQQRTTALALKLAEMEIFKEINGEYPVLLLDDVLSELDVQRQKHLLEYSQKAQILLTTACQIDQRLLDGLSYYSFTLKDGTATKC